MSSNNHTSTTPGAIADDRHSAFAERGLSAEEVYFRKLNDARIQSLAKKQQEQQQQQQ
ncbi:hypothetical protein BC828DRAFT_409927 [Blastocladiella britannica]|nr:hypothetical protein BC828DRAFT_409927 [Blastocladiella britannica]